MIAPIVKLAPIDKVTTKLALKMANLLLQQIILWSLVQSEIPVVKESEQHWPHTLQSELRQQNADFRSHGVLLQLGCGISCDARCGMGC